MSKKMQTEKQDRKETYHGNIPSELVGEMTPEVRRQYFLWDEMFKRQIEMYPSQLFPVVKEIFGKEYPAGTEVMMRSTEYVVDKVYEQGEKRIESIRSDLLIQIGNKDLYHMECQMRRDGHMAVRMLEYDMNIALREADADGDGKKVRFPQSAILYLDGMENIPDTETCTLIFQDGTEYEYQVPVLKVQGYTPEMVYEKGLCILIPFLPIRFRHRFEAILKKRENPVRKKNAYEEMEALKKDLTKFIGECIMIIKREEENGTLSNTAGADIVELMGKACDHLYMKEPGLLKEVHEVMEPAIKLLSERKDEEIAAIKLQNERKDEEIAAIKLLSEKKDEEIAAIKLLSEKKDEEIAAIELLSERKDEEIAAIKLLSEKKDEEIAAVKLQNEKKNEEITKQKRDLELQIMRKDEQLMQKDEQFGQLMYNYIQQCKEEGKTKSHTMQVLQKIFSISLSDAQEKIEKCW